jgi:hypothetical protein
VAGGESVSYNRATYVSLLFFIVMGLVFYVSSLSIPKAIASQKIGPAYFPQIISILLILCCILSFFKTRKKVDEHIKLPNFRFIIITVILMIIFVVIWSLFESFYITSFAFLGVLIYTYNQEKQSLKKVLISAAISFVLVAFVYVIFERILGISF